MFSLLLTVAFGVVICLMTANCRVVLILSNGFAGNYLNWSLDQPGYVQFKKQGVWSQKLIPEFPTLSTPNHYSLVTGQHPINHGVVDNYVFDRKLQEKFMIDNTDSVVRPSWWTGNEPIWVTASRHKRNTGLFYWMGCQIRFDPSVQPTVCIPHVLDTASPTLTVENLDHILPSLNKHDFTLLYHNEIDVAGHKLGPSQLAAEQKPSNPVFRFAGILQTIVQNADRDMNIVVLADHGMTALPHANIRLLEKYIPMEIYVQYTVGAGAVKQIIPIPGKAHEIYYILTKVTPIPNVSIHWTTPGNSTVPSRFHYHYNSRISELVLIAEPGYGIYTRLHDKQFPNPINVMNDGLQGAHGYDNLHDDMAGMFFAHGPAFKRGYHKPFAHLVDVYSLLCHLLNITAHCKQHDGSFDRIKDILVGFYSPTSSTTPSNIESDFKLSETKREIKNDCSVTRQTIYVFVLLLPYAHLFLYM